MLDIAAGVCMCVWGVTDGSSSKRVCVCVCMRLCLRACVCVCVCVTERGRERAAAI